MVNLSKDATSHALAVDEFSPMVKGRACHVNPVCQSIAIGYAIRHLAKYLHCAAIDEMGLQYCPYIAGF